jgi:hypothetical protein
MRHVVFLVAGALVGGCGSVQPASPGGGGPLAAAEAFVDAFYSFDAGRLRAAMAAAPESQPSIVYYQGWAEGGNYQVLERKPCRMEGAQEASCSITVRDDLIAALGTGFDVTDTFHITFKDGRIVRVRTSSNDPPEFEQALQWLRKERPGLMTGPCEGFFEGGPTPQDCARAVVGGFAEFKARAGS